MKIRKLLIIIVSALILAAFMLVSSISYNMGMSYGEENAETIRKARVTDSMVHEKTIKSVSVRKRTKKTTRSRETKIKRSRRARGAKSEVVRLVCDNTKILKKTNWKPKIKFDKGLDKTINWYKNFKFLFEHDIYHI